jgi:hypothetical protein
MIFAPVRKDFSQIHVLQTRVMPQDHPTGPSPTGQKQWILSQPLADQTTCFIAKNAI